MKTIRDVMTSDVIRLSPTNKIKTAIILMKGHNIGGLPVLEEDQVVGVLDYHDVLGKDNDTLVQHIMDREFVTVPPEMSVADAANLMTRIGSGRLLVMHNGQLIGVVTRADLLPELGKSFDPITGLPRADAMRDWGIEALKRGLEITVIFMDLDEFGQFNKKYGHITGDRVLKHVARILQTHVEEERDMLCRYAGDEFVVVTTRNSEDARALADLLNEKVRTTENQELPEPVTGSIGVHGGKRTKEREDVHYEATLDNLINLASKSCTRAKSQGVAVALPDGVGILPPPAAPPLEPPPEAAAAAPAAERAQEPVPVQPAAPPVEPSPEAAAAAPAAEQAPERAPVQPAARREEFVAGPTRRLRIQGLNLSWGAGSTVTAEVELADGDNAHKSSRSGFALGNNALRLVADATAEAASQFLPTPGYGVIAESVQVVPTGTGGDVVLVTALFITPQSQVRASGSSVVKQDAYRAAAAALLNAVNRHISTLIQPPPEA